MNLKEAFHYMNFIKAMFDEARSEITNQAHAYTITKYHKRNEANPDATDVTEEQEERDFYCNDDVIMVMKALINEKELLCAAIANAKFDILQKIGLSIDQATECNKMRREAASALNTMLRFKKSKRIERGSSYKINVEGNQSQYYYDIEVTREEAFDRSKAKEFSKYLSDTADKISYKIEFSTVNCTVDFTPRFDVNSSFDDIMEEFMKTSE